MFSKNFNHIPFDHKVKKKKSDIFEKVIKFQ